jgi:hypothetical protein
MDIRPSFFNDVRIIDANAARELVVIKQQCLAAIEPEAPAAADISQSSEDSEIRSAVRGRCLLSVPFFVSLAAPKLNALSCCRRSISLPQVKKEKFSGEEAPMAIDADEAEEDEDEDLDPNTLNDSDGTRAEEKRVWEYISTAVG